MAKKSYEKGYGPVIPYPPVRSVSAQARNLLHSFAPTLEGLSSKNFPPGLLLATQESLKVACGSDDLVDLYAALMGLEFMQYWVSSSISAGMSQLFFDLSELGFDLALPWVDPADAFSRLVRPSYVVYGDYMQWSTSKKHPTAL